MGITGRLNQIGPNPPTTTKPPVERQPKPIRNWYFCAGNLRREATWTKSLKAELAWYFIDQTKIIFGFIPGLAIPCIPGLYQCSLPILVLLGQPAQVDLRMLASVKQPLSPVCWSQMRWETPEVCIPNYMQEPKLRVAFSGRLYSGIHFCGNRKGTKTIAGQHKWGVWPAKLHCQVCHSRFPPHPLFLGFRHVFDVPPRLLFRAFCRSAEEKLSRSATSA